MKSNLWEGFERIVERFPDREAIIHGDQHSTFRDCLRRARAYGAVLHRAGVKPHDRIIVWMNQSPEMAAAILGAWSRGAVAVLMSPASPAVHFQHAMETVEPAAVVTTPDLRLPVSVVALVLVSEEVKDANHLPEPVSILPTDPASIVFTSGSTGPPKGVTQTHGNLRAGCRAVAACLGYTEQDRILCPIPWSFDYGYGQLLSTLQLGLTHILPTVLNPFGISEAVTRYHPTVLPGIPSVFTYLFRGISPFLNTEISSIRLVTNTGGTIPRPVLNDMFEVFAGRQIVLNYGLTETYRTSFLDSSLVREKPDSIGKPIPGVDVAVVREDGSLCEPGEEGQIVHRGSYIFSGYWNDPESTAETLRPDPLLPPGAPGPLRAVFTGDFGVKDREGFLYFRGRRDQQLKPMGVRVNPHEIAQLFHESGLIREAAVFGKKHDFIGDEIWAAVVPNDGVDKAEIKLRQFARRVMSVYMQPQRYIFKQALPRTANGKIDYPALKREADATPSASLVR